MHLKFRQQAAAFFIIASVLFSLSACGPDDANITTSRKSSASSSESASDTVKYKRQPIRITSCEKSDFFMDGSFGVYLDNVSDGYVCAVGESDKRLKFRVMLGEQEYFYDLKNNGTAEAFPLQMGNGEYTLEIWENIKDTRYSQVFTTKKEVVLTDEFAPFLVPSQIVSFDQSSEVVSLANQITENASTEAEVVESIYKYITDTISYNTEFAQKVQARDVTSYVPDLDQVLKQKSGICYDYSSLCAAMLRSQGIPTKLVTGNVAPNDVYHAWNMVYLKDSGWTYKKIRLEKNAWGRIDTTLAAGSNSTQLGDFVGNGQNYIEKKVY